MRFKESELAHKYCIGKGVEIGGATHNTFGLENCLNCAPRLDEKFYAESQKKMDEIPMKIDLYGTADQIPVEDNFFNYVISSHVIEHVPDILGAFFEWKRILKPGGIIFIIFPKRDALPSDIGRPLSLIDDMDKVYIEKNKIGEVDIDNHIWVFDLALMMHIVKFLNSMYDFDFDILEALETDDKVGNGHEIILKKRG